MSASITKKAVAPEPAVKINDKPTSLTVQPENVKPQATPPSNLIQTKSPKRITQQSILAMTASKRRMEPCFGEDGLTAEQRRVRQSRPKYPTSGIMTPEEKQEAFAVALRRHKKDMELADRRAKHARVLEKMRLEFEALDAGEQSFPDAKDEQGKTITTTILDEEFILVRKKKKAPEGQDDVSKAEISKLAKQLEELDIELDGTTQPKQKPATINYAGLGKSEAA